MKMLWAQTEVAVALSCNVLNVTELSTLKWLVLSFMSFISKHKIASVGSHDT